MTSSVSPVDVVAYIAVGTDRVGPRHDDLAHARRDRAADRARAAPRPLRPPHVALAALFLPAEGRLDHRAPDERRRRPLGRPQPGADDARRQLAHAARGDRRPLPARLAPRRRRARRAAARDLRDPLVPDGVARRIRRRANAHRGRDGAARRVRRRHGRRPGVQPRAGLPARVRRPQRGEPHLERPRAEALVRSSSRRSSSSG